MIEDYRTAQEVRARASFRNDVRFRAVVDHAVHRSLAKGGIDPEHREESAYQLATEVAAIVLQVIYEEDAEIQRLKAEVSIYKAAYEKMALLTISPPLLFFSADSLEGVRLEPQIAPADDRKRPLEQR